MAFTPRTSFSTPPAPSHGPKKFANASRPAAARCGSELYIERKFAAAALGAVLGLLSAVPSRGAGATAAPVPVPAAVQSFALGQVELLDSPFRAAMERNAAYLLSIEPDRLLHNTREYAGLTPKGKLYGGWESKGIAGHILGHYMSALAQQFAATGDVRYRQRLDYIVGEMAVCQAAYGDGYVGALPPKELATIRGFKEGRIEVDGRFNFKNGAWVPWYTEHKVLQGLTDAWVLGGCAAARPVALRLADWADDVTAHLTPEQLEAMLSVEHGGMMDVLVQLYTLTGEPRYLATARRFTHHAVIDPLLAGRDELAGRHANTQIPKIIGQARLYEATGEPEPHRVAENFWDLVVQHHSYVIGGNSDNEHFFPEEKTRDHLTPGTAESCNTYNILKLTTELYHWYPKVEYVDFYERALYNDILATQEPRQGMYAYFMALAPGFFRTYSTPYDSFWCCVGTGMENHSKYGGAIFAHDDSSLYINLFIPSQLTWAERGLAVKMDTDYPTTGIVQLTVTAAPVKPTTVQVRCPAWAAAPVTFTINGEPWPIRAEPGTYAKLSRQWRQGDVVRAVIPLAVRTETLPGAADQVAFLYGPLVLAGDLGTVPADDGVRYAQEQKANFHAAAVAAPAMWKHAVPLAQTLRRLPDVPLAFEADAATSSGKITLRPFWTLHYQRYVVYWDILNEAPVQPSAPARVVSSP